MDLLFFRIAFFLVLGISDVMGFVTCGDFLIRNSADENQNGIMPSLVWKNAPSRTKSFVLIMSDLGVPHEPATLSKDESYLLIFNIPATTLRLTKDFKTLSQETKLGENRLKPRLDQDHRYLFKLYALDIELSLEEGAPKQEIEKAMQGHVLKEAQLMVHHDKNTLVAHYPNAISLR